MNEKVEKLYKIMLEQDVKEITANYFHKTCLMIFVTHGVQMDDWWYEDNHETIVLDCEGYW